MFRNKIPNTPMTSNAANDFFQNITGGHWQDDVTFLSTLRALIAPRMQEGERLHLKFSGTNYSPQTISDNTEERVVTSMVDAQYMNPGTIVVHNLNGGADGNQACLELVKRAFCDVYDGWHRLEKVTELFRKAFGVLCFVNPSKKCVAIFVNDMNIQKMHYLQCAVFGFLPWYFNPEEGVSEDDMALAKSLQDKTSTAYEDYIAKAAEKYDFKTARIHQLLSGFEKRFERRECDRVCDEIREIDGVIQDRHNSVSRLLKQRREAEIRLCGLQIKFENSGEESEIQDYFLANQKLTLESVNDDIMSFVVSDYLTYYDEDMALSMIENKNSFIYVPGDRRCNNYIQAEDMERLMRAIFINQSLKIKLCAAYWFDIGGQSVRALGGFSYGFEFKECTPNPHIDGYSCLGTHMPAINNLLRDNNYIGAVEQCVASCKSLNFADSVVMSTFMKRLYGLPGHTDVNNRCIELPDGRVLTAREAAEWLKAEEGENE